MKLFRIITFMALALSAIYAYSQPIEFKFSATKVSGVKSTGIFDNSGQNFNITINVMGQGARFMVTEESNPLGLWQGTWYLNEKGVLIIKDSQGKEFRLVRESCMASVKDGSSVVMFSEPKSRAAFRTSYDKFIAYLKQIGKLQGGSTSGASVPPSRLNGTELKLVKMCGTPFGYKPVKGHRYTIDDINRAAKEIWGWDLQLNYKTNQGGLTWPKLNGMKFLGYPIYRIYSTGYNDDFNISNFCCEFIIANTAAAKANAKKALKSYFSSYGWKYYTESEMLFFYKGNVEISCSCFPSEKFSGKLEVEVNVLSLPTAADVITRKNNGVG